MRLIFQCVNVDRIRILSVRLDTSNDRFYFSPGNQRPTCHPQPVQNLILARRGSIHSVPVDVRGVGLTQEIVAMYWDGRARQFIFRGSELLSQRAELEWFAMAPVRRQQAIARRLETRRRNDLARQQAIAGQLDRIHQLQRQAMQPNQLNQNGAPRPGNQPQPNQQPNNNLSSNRRPNFGRIQPAVGDQAGQQNQSIPLANHQQQPNILRAPLANQQPRNHHLRPIDNSTPIVQRPLVNNLLEHNHNAQRNREQNATLANLFNDQNSIISPAAGQNVGNFPNLNAQPNQVELPAQVPSTSAGSGNQEVAAHDGSHSNSSMSRMDVEQTLQANNANQAAALNESRKRQHVQSSSSEDSV